MHRGVWSAAPTAASGTITVTGNDSYPTPPVPLVLDSCYSYTETLAATTDSLAATSPAGGAHETVQVPPAPTVTTTANQTTVDPRTAVTDSVVITGTGGGTGTLAWSLVGPVAPNGTSCAGLDWTGAPAVSSGTPRWPATAR